MDGTDDQALHHTSPEVSPGQKKSRGKYTSRACADCRNRKLKCSGDEPCQRCLRRNQQCRYNDDRTVAAHVRRSRQPLPTSIGPSNYGSLDDRIEKIETAVQGLTDRLDREGLSKDSDEIVTLERSGYQGETAFQSPIETLNASLLQVKRRFGLNAPVDNASVRSTSSITSNGQSTESDHVSSERSIRVGALTLPFPSAAECRRYIDFFFEDINACHPCVNENDFRTRSNKLTSRDRLDRRESCFLALHYIIFACADVLLELSRPHQQRLSPGWKWYQAADSLIGRSKFNGQGDLSLIQYLILEAFYLTHQDRPNAAYNISGLACRLCFQFGLHQQSCWDESPDSYQSHMKQRILWTAYFVDRRIALSCGRPHGISDRDIDVALPAWLSDKELHPDSPIPQVNHDDSYMPYLSCMITFAKFSGDIWDHMFSAEAQKAPTSAETIAVLDAKIKYWADNILPTIPLLPTTPRPLKRHMRQYILVLTRVNHLRLLLRRRLMVSLTYSSHDGRLCGELAMEIIQQITQHSDEARQPSSFRFHMAMSLGSALLILGTLLCQPLPELGLQEYSGSYADAFRRGLALLEDLSTGLFAARRMLFDLRDIIQIVKTIIEQSHTSPGWSNVGVPTNIDSLLPYGAVDFAQQSGSGYPYETYFGVNDAHDFAYNNYDPWLNGWDASELGLPTANQGYGVPWI